jgi:glycerol-3-phosphate dehydrogenase
MLSVAGGKMTTYRRIALGALARLRSDLGLHRIDDRVWPLPGAGDAASVRLPVELERPVRDHLLHLYGNHATYVVAPAFDDPTLLEPLHPSEPDIGAQALYAATDELQSAEDVIRRRTTLFYRGFDDKRVVRRVEELLVRAAAP